MSGPLFKGAEAHYVAAPVWHPDGRRLAFTTMRKGDFDTYWKDLNAATPPEALLVTDGDDILGAFAPDGLTAIVRLSEPNGTYPMKTMTLAPRGQPKPLTTQDGNHPAISPDGKHVAFVSDRAGRGGDLRDANGRRSGQSHQHARRPGGRLVGRRARALLRPST